MSQQFAWEVASIQFRKKNPTQSRAEHKPQAIYHLQYYLPEISHNS